MKQLKHFFFFWKVRFRLYKPNFQKYHCDGEEQEVKFSKIVILTYP